MELTKYVSSIQDLPEEMLENVFSFLDLEHQKSSSLVCLRWSRIAIRPSNTVLIVDFNRFTEEKYRQQLLKSNRFYKHLRIVSVNNINFEELVKNIIAKFRHTLLSLELVKVDNFKQIWELCSNIQCLNITKCFGDSGDPQFTQELGPLTNLRHLTTTAKFLHLPGIDLRRLTPNLTALSIEFPKSPAIHDIPTDVLDHFAPRLTQLQLEVAWFRDNLDYFRPIWQRRFPQLVRFRCDLGSKVFPYTEHELTNFLGKCENLEVVSLSNHADFGMEFFRNLARSCRKLRELSLGSVFLDQDIFEQLSQMKQLKQFRTSNSIVNIKVLDSNSTSNNLQELVLGTADIRNMEDFNKSIANAFPKLIKLKVKHSSNAPLRLSDLKRLENVHLETFNSSLVMFHELASLPTLRTVTLVCPKLDTFNRRIKLPNLGHIRKLTVWTHLDDGVLRQLAQLFPGIRRLEICGRLRFTRDGLRDARKLLPPDCEVRLIADGEILPRTGLTVEKKWCCELKGKY